MSGLIPRPYLILALVLAVAAAISIPGVKAYRMGYSASEARHAADLLKAQRETAEAAELASRKEQERLAAEAARAEKDRELEDAAARDPDADRMCLGPDSVQRLNSR